MHHKRRSRRRDKRTMLACGCCEDIRQKSAPEPFESEICMGKARISKRPKKERCPVNGTHEWYKEWITERDYYRPSIRCTTCADPRYDCVLHSKKIYYTQRVRTATCIHCLTQKILRREQRANYDPFPLYRQEKRLRIPKRPVRY